jgi:alpha-galactosidase
MADVWYDEAAGTWLLEMRTTAYAMGLADDGTALRHLYWGSSVPRSAVRELAADAVAGPPAQERRRVGGRPDEFIPWGGLRYDEPSLKAEFADGTRAIEWRFAGQRVTRYDAATTLEIDLADTAYDLRVTLSYQVYDGFDVLERWATLRGDQLVIRQAHSASWWLPPRPGLRLRYLCGGWAAETQLADTPLTPGKLVLESRQGITSHHLSPWFAIHAGAAEESGEIWSGALAWSGSWKIVHETTPAGRVHVSGGWNDFDWSHRLTAGEELALPVFAGLYTDGGFGAASREWHAWQRAHVLRTRLRPVLYNSWEATSFAVSEDGQARLAELAAQIGAECFVMDDGWFPGRHHDRAGLGDWTPDPRKFPRGLTPLIERVNKLGMRFGLWIEPEMTNPDSDLYRAHPDWVYHFANRSRSEQRNQLVLNLARPDVAEWVFQTIDGLLSSNNIEFIKWDMNRPFSEPGWPGDPAGNPERIWVSHVRNLYAILDRLRAAHPGVEFESCAAGGGRVDLGIMRRVDQVWTSDNTDAWDRVRIQHGFTQAYPPQAMMAWVTDSPNFLTGRRLPLSFRFHVAMAGSLGIGGDLPAWTAEELAEAAELVAVYKEIRPVIQQGLLYRLDGGSALHAGQALSAGGTLAGDDALRASEYVLGDQVVVLAWWGPQQCGIGLPRLRLAGLDPVGRYRDVATGATRTGGFLMRNGIRLPSDTDYTYGSALLHLVGSALCEETQHRPTRWTT